MQTSLSPAVLTERNSLPASAHPAPGRFYRPELDVVRFLAFLLVFLNHTLPHSWDSLAVSFPKGLALGLFTLTEVFHYGLSLFFTLSAYLICELLLREREATGTIQIKQFYIRRILRIWPLYFAGLGIALIIALRSGDRMSIHWIGWSAILLGNWFIIFNGSVSSPMGPLWSISVEEQFYLLAPWVVKRFNRKWLFCFALLLVFLANLCLMFLGFPRWTGLDPWYNSFVQFENFAAGMLLCLLLRGRALGTRAWQRVAFLVATGLCWFFASYEFVRHRGGSDSKSVVLVGGYALITLGCCCLLVAFLGLDQKILPPWAIYFGRISYGLYVFHGLALYIVSRFHEHKTFGSPVWLLKGVTAAGLTFLFASLSYRYFETPFLRLKRRHEIVESRPL